MAMGRSRGGMTPKIHAVVDTKGLPLQLGLTTSEAQSALLGSPKPIKPTNPVVGPG
jgi:hypothetical protein